jgi:hypothetical protein
MRFEAAQLAPSTASPACAPRRGACSICDDLLRVWARNQRVDRRSRVVDVARRKTRVHRESDVEQRELRSGGRDLAFEHRRVAATP